MRLQIRRAITIAAYAFLASGFSAELHYQFDHSSVAMHEAASVAVNAKNSQAHQSNGQGDDCPNCQQLASSVSYLLDPQTTSWWGLQSRLLRPAHDRCMGGVRNNTPSAPRAPPAC